jgi:hypothetical protein
MKASKLKLTEGNYCNINIFGTGDKPISRILNAKLTYEDLAKYKDFDPIPLTEEILLKCGFIKSTLVEGCYFHNQKERLYISIANQHAIHFGNINGVLVMIDYLHQLQNLYFALTGEELNIEL